MDQIFSIIAGIILILLCLIKVIFTIVIITIIIRYWNRRCRSILNLHVCNSCGCSLFYIFAVCIQIPLLLRTTYDINQNSKLFCALRGFIFVAACGVKYYSYVFHAISRYIITIHYQKKKLLTYHANVIMIVMSWFTGLTITSFSFCTLFDFQYEPSSHLCVFGTKNNVLPLYLTIAIFLTPLLIIIFLYARVLWSSTNFNRIHPNSVSSMRMKRQMKLFRNILLIVMILLIGAMPYFISIVVNSITPVLQIFHLISILFISLSSTLELLVIFLTNEHIKRTFQAFISRHNRKPIPKISII